MISQTIKIDDMLIRAGSRPMLPLMGLRADNQLTQRREILENAFAYMCAHSGELPTMAALARSCAVSEATVFNYIGQRDALRAEWAHRSLAERCRAVARDDGGSLRRIVRRTTRALRDQLDAQPEVWLRVWSAGAPVDPAAGRPGGPAPGDENADVTDLVRIAQDRGEVRTDVDAAVQASALVSAWVGALAREARHAEGAPIDDTGWRRVGSAVELVLDGLRRRNERVRVASTAEPVASVRAPAGT